MIRSLAAPDAPAVHSILQKAASAGSPGAPAWTPEQTAMEVALGNGLGLFADPDPARLAAFVLSRATGDIREIVYLATDPDFTRRGFMAHLLDALLLQTPATSEVWLDVHENNRPARGLYERLGFEATGTRRAYYADGGDALLCSRRGKAPSGSQ